MATKWTKKLYLKTNYPDNYTDTLSFLELKKTNVNAKFYTYWTTVYHSGKIMHQISSVVIFALIYVYLRFELINIYDLMLIYIVPLCLVGYLVKLTIEKNNYTLIKIKNDLMNLVKFLFFTYGLSPILNSLTETISSDTIFAMSTFMLALNLITHNYEDSSDVAMYMRVIYFFFENLFIILSNRVSKTFSFNAALFACVCLASRFNTSPFHTFSLISISFIVFALWPEYRIYLQVVYLFIFI